MSGASYGGEKSPNKAIVILNEVKDLNQVSLDALAVRWFRSFSRIADSSVGKTLLQDDVRFFWEGRLRSP